MNIACKILYSAVYVKGNSKLLRAAAEAMKDEGVDKQAVLFTDTLCYECTEEFRNKQTLFSKGKESGTTACFPFCPFIHSEHVGPSLHSLPKIVIVKRTQSCCDLQNICKLSCINKKYVAFCNWIICFEKHPVLVILNMLVNVFL